MQFIKAIKANRADKERKRVQDRCHDLAEFVDEILNLEGLGDNREWVIDLYNFLARVTQGKEETNEAWIDSTRNDMYELFIRLTDENQKRREAELHAIKEREAAHERARAQERAQERDAAREKAIAEAREEHEAACKKEQAEERERERDRAEAAKARAEAQIVRDAEEARRRAEAAKARAEAQIVRDAEEARRRAYREAPNAVIKSIAHGTYLCVDGDKVCHTTEPFLWRVVRVDGTVLLQPSGSSHHLSGSPDRAVVVHENSFDWERWVLEGDGIKSFKHGTYLSVSDTGIVNLQPHKLDWERLSLMIVP
jgi:hypothetical protein